MKLLKDKFFWIFIIGFIITGGLFLSGNMEPNEEYITKDTFETRCLSSWDGSFRSIIEGVKGNLKDPTSFEHVETTYSNETDGTHLIIMKYRAKNGFGALDVSALKLKSDDNCNVIGKMEEL